MHKFDNNIHLSEGRSSLASAFFIIAIFFLGFQGIGSFVGIGIANLFYEGDIVQGMLNPEENPGIKYPAYMIQGIAAVIGLIIIPFYYLKFREQKGLGMFFQKKIPAKPIIITPLIVISFMGVLSVVIEWNSTAKWPDAFSELETIAREAEDRLESLTTLLTTFDSPIEFLLALLIVAVIPSIGEEILFRGLLQNELHKASRNPHVAIWVSALVFSAIHFQFFGFFPRMLLGALFGYLYYWSGNLIIPMLAHFVNNGFSLTLSYIATGENLFGNAENTESATLPAVLIFLIIATGLIYYFRNYFVKLDIDNDQVAEGV